MYQQEIDSKLAWVMLLALNRKPAVSLPCSLSMTGSGKVLVSPMARQNSLLQVTETGWCSSAAVSEEATFLFDLYLPLCRPRCTDRYIVAHLGQSLDGRIATRSGASNYVTGPENITHLHRMRALFDGVLVGANTVFYDDPQLTTRKVAGPNPVRIALDPRKRLHAGYRVFSDAAVKTLWVSGQCSDAARCRSESLETIDTPTATDVCHSLCSRKNWRIAESSAFSSKAAA